LSPNFTLGDFSQGGHNFSGGVASSGFASLKSCFALFEAVRDLIENAILPACNMRVYPGAISTLSYRLLTIGNALLQIATVIYQEER